MSEESQTQENITEENSVLAEPKKEVVESVSVAEETPAITEVVTNEQVAPIEEVENQTEQIETPSSVAKAMEDKEVIETTEISQTETEPIPPTAKVESSIVEAVENKPSQPTQQNQVQETPTQTQPQIKIVEKIVYQTPPNFIQNLLNKARAKIQERKRKKLDKILLLFETKSQITNSDIQKLLRVSRATAKRYMDILEKENKVDQIGSVGKGVFYSKK